MFVKYSQKIEHLEKDTNKHDKQILDLIKQLATLEGGVDRDRNGKGAYVKSKSPLSLTDKGKALLLDSKGDEYIKNNKLTLLDNIKNRAPKNAYDVQEYVKTAIIEASTSDTFNELKNYAFKKGLDLDVITEVLAIVLRDTYFDEVDISLRPLKDD